MKAKYNFFKNAGYAFSGIRVLLQESAFKIELFIIIPLVIISFFLDKSLIEHVLLVAVLILILAAEAFNTAIEAAVDLASIKWHKKAKIAKDCASAGVLLCNILGAFTWIAIVFY